MKKLNEREIKKLKILEDYMDVDYEKEEVTLTIKKEKASDLFTDLYKNDDKPMIDGELLESIDEFATYIPDHYKVNTKIQVEDYEDNDPKKLGKSLRNLLELNFYKLYKVDGKAWIKMATLLLTGVGILILLGVLVSMGILNVDNKITDYIVDYIADTAACVLIWEAISVVFLYPSDFSIRYRSVFKRINDFSFVDEEGKELWSVKREEYLSDWIDDPKAKKLARICLIICSCIFISMGLIELIDVIFCGHQLLEVGNTLATGMFVSLTLLSIVNLLIGTTCMLRYLEVTTHSILSNILATILFIINTMSLVFTITCQNKGIDIQPSAYVTLFLVFVALFIYFFAMIKTSNKKQ